MKFSVTTGGGCAVVTISCLKKGDRLYSEIKKLRSISESVERNIMTAEDLVGEGFRKKKRFTRLGKLHQKHLQDDFATNQRVLGGESPYVVCEATDNNQEVSYHCQNGTILVWNARPVDELEFYVIGNFFKSYKSRAKKNRPHGVLIAVKGSFLCADLKVKPSLFMTRSEQILQFSKTQDKFQRFSGNGMVCLEAKGTLTEMPLRPGESKRIVPGTLLAFTEGITLSMVSAGPPDLRNEENNDYLIELTAGKKGGYCYTSCVD